MSDTIYVPFGVIDQTLAQLQSAGRQRKECVVLWLGRRRDERLDVAEAYLPQQIAAVDFFRIPPAAMSALLTYLGEKNLMIAAQVHSHPAAAFHSQADDKWAIVRHLDAFSLVLPRFGNDTNRSNFKSQAAAFTLTASNRWVQLDQLQVDDRIRLI